MNWLLPSFSLLPDQLQCANLWVYSSVLFCRWDVILHARKLALKYIDARPQKIGSLGMNLTNGAYRKCIWHSGHGNQGIGWWGFREKVGKLSFKRSKSSDHVICHQDSLTKRRMLAYGSFCLSEDIHQSDGLVVSGRNPNWEAEDPSFGHFKIACWINTCRRSLWFYCRTWCKGTRSSHVRVSLIL